MADLLMEWYRGDVEIEAEAEQALAAVDPRVQMAKELGLGLQNHATTAEALDLASKFYGAEMGQEEFRVWTEFLRTAYSKQRGGWEQYGFDLIPNEVMGEIHFADSLGVFHDLLIWTPERTNHRMFDPMVVGVIHEPGGKLHRFKIVRWGEALAKFESISEALERRKQSVRRKVWAACTTLLLALVAIDAALIVLAHGKDWGWVLAGAVFVFCIGDIWIFSASESTWRVKAEKRFPVRNLITAETLAASSA